MAADRGAYICQSQSLNVFVDQPNFGKLTSMHFYAWKKGLKTGMYYLRSKSAADAIKFTIDKEQATDGTAGNAAASADAAQQKISDMACSLDNPENCEACGS